MSDLSLPILDRDASARSALAEMKRRAICGIVVRHKDQFQLYTAGQVVVALSDNPDATLVDIEPVGEISPNMPQNQEATLRGYSITAGRRADFGDTEEVNEVTFSVEADLLRLLQGSPQDCYCKVDGKPVADGKTGEDCPDGHHGSVRCV